ncbi:hypothetical protein BDA96_01G483600 [Sorghum bicolor]|uniref:Uncharacterized protein n=1 Tax=Sorghum bicolor TaxID=4558 RepID=A0A921S625_SORBI|nr:hypothetical protein BDA96_01G483600 [Sorghum bicolor]
MCLICSHNKNHCLSFYHYRYFSDESIAHPMFLLRNQFLVLYLWKSSVKYSACIWYLI